MFLTGYHGTSNASADEIVKTKKFHISKGDKQWLGDGIYFYPCFEDAYNWHNINTGMPTESIIHAIVEIKESEYLDLDTFDGKALFNSISNYICEVHGVSVKPSSAQQNQCAVARMIWDTYEELRVVFASFSTEPTKLKTLIDARPKRREFCIRDNSCIKYISQIKRSDFDD